MNDLQIFNSVEFGEVRTDFVDGKPMFVASDVAQALGYSNPRKAVIDHCKGVTKRDTPTSSGIQSISWIGEGDLYRLIAKSKLPSAERFESWVFDEVLPSIRATGSYNLPTTYKQALQQLLIEVEKRELLEIENKEMKPKADFFDAVADSKSAIPMNEVAKVLGVHGYGRNNLFEFLRNEGILDRNNIPYQRYVDCGWFRVIEQAYTKNGEKHINFKTLVYQKGVDAIRKRILKGENVCRSL